MSRVPTLLTGRLVLRAHRPDDADACAAMWSDPDVVRHITNTPSTRSQSWSRMLNYAGLWSLLGYGYWAIEERGTHAFVGDVGLADFHRPLQPSIEGTPEAGWVLAKPHWGRGYATEAVRAMLAWADATLAHDRTVAIVAPEHLASIRVAQRAGFVETGNATLSGESTVLFVRAKR